MTCAAELEGGGMAGIKFSVTCGCAAATSRHAPQVVQQCVSHCRRIESKVARRRGPQRTKESVNSGQAGA